MGTEKGLKYDGFGGSNGEEKIRYELIPVGPIEGLAKILTFGAKKYKAHSWQNVKPIYRYYGALLRHLELVRQGEWLDSESGLPHLHHALCNVVFLSELLKDKSKEELINEFNGGTDNG